MAQVSDIDYSALPETVEHTSIRRVFLIVSLCCFGFILAVIGLAIVFPDATPNISESVFDWSLIGLLFIGGPILAWLVFRKLRQREARQAAAMKSFASANHWQFKPANTLDGTSELVPPDLGPVYGKILYTITGATAESGFDLFALRAYVKQKFSGRMTLAYQTVLRVPLATSIRPSADNSLTILEKGTHAFIIMNSNAHTKSEFERIFNSLNQP